MDKVKMLGVEVSRLTHGETLKTLVEDITNNRKRFVVTANPEILSYAHKHKDYLSILQKADMVTADGIGVVKGARLLGQRIPERVTGIDMFINLLNVANEKGYTIYLLGAADHVVKNTVDLISYEYPNIKIAGSYNGFFDWNKDQSIVNEIQRKKPDLVFVALGFPLQEQWISKHIDAFEKGIFIGVGGSFDVIGGEVKRAPAIWRKLNVEWLYRLVKNPSRWRRTITLPLFLLHLLQQKQQVDQGVEQKEEQSL